MKTNQTTQEALTKKDSPTWTNCYSRQFWYMKNQGGILKAHGNTKEDSIILPNVDNFSLRYSGGVKGLHLYRLKGNKSERLYSMFCLLRKPMHQLAK